MDGARPMGEPLSLREVQMVEYGILERVVRLFGEHGIHYLFSGGTLLGAIRHDGFIPWDDDIDVFVPRDDYERLKAIIAGMGRSYDGVRFNLPGDAGSPHPFIKAVDSRYVAMEERRPDKYRAFVWIDIFPLDHFPDGDLAHRWWLLRISSLIKVLNANTLSDSYMASRGFYSNPSKRVMLAGSRVLYRLLGGCERIAARIDRTARRMDAKYRDSNHVGDGAWPNGMKDYYELRCVQPVMKHRFEGGEFNVPVNYDAYLTTFYGDWRRIPPEDERVDHCIEVYRVDCCGDEVAVATGADGR